MTPTNPIRRRLRDLLAEASLVSEHERSSA